MESLAVHHIKPDDTRVPRAHLEEALREAKAGKNVFVLSLVARMAEEGNMPDLALQTYQAMALPEYGREQEVLEKCWQMASLIKDSGELQKIAERLAQLRPANLLLVQRRDYLRLLRGDSIETTLRDSVNDKSSGGQNDLSCLLFALKAYRLNDMRLVKANLNKIKALDDFTSGERAVCAGLLAMNGNQARAYEIAENLKSQVLLQEETTFWKKAF